MTGGFYSLQAVYQAVPRMTEAFRTGQGMSWGDHCNCLFCGTEKFFGPGYRANLVSTWLPALDGVVHGYSTAFQALRCLNAKNSKTAPKTARIKETGSEHKRRLKAASGATLDML
jgi:hypothetical protein